jgi:hypothetical protein
VSEDTFTDARIASATVVCAHCHELPHAGRSCLDAALTALAREREAREELRKDFHFQQQKRIEAGAARSQLEAAVEKLRHLLSSPGSMGYNEIRAEGLAIIESALRSSRGEGT